MLYVEKTTPEDCFELAKNLKQVDKYELAIWGLDPLQALLQPFRYTKRKVHTYTIFDKNKEVAAIFGTVSSRQSDKVGTIWLLSSEVLDKNYLYFLKRNKYWTEYLEKNYDYLSNYITAEHTKSIKWLKWQGYKFSKPMLVNNVKMYYFYKRIQNCIQNRTQPILNDVGPSWTTSLPQKR